jgi:hypothetical protein
LVGILNGGDTELTPEELQQFIESRVKHKPIVTITLSNGHVEVRYRKNKVCIDKGVCTENFKY